MFSAAFRMSYLHITASCSFAVKNQKKNDKEKMNKVKFMDNKRLLQLKSFSVFIRTSYS